MRSFFALALSATLAGRAAAELNITFGAPLGNITASDLITIPSGSLQTTCQTKCSPAQTNVNSCNGLGSLLDQNNCLCNSNTTAAVTECHQCWFETLIATNEPKPDPRAGSTPGLAAYTAACTDWFMRNNETGPDGKTLLVGQPMALTLPANWLGPRDIILNQGETIITVGFGGILALGALMVLSNV